MSTTRVAAGDAALEVTRTGAGPRAVLLHAGIADSRMWRDLVPALEPTHEVLRYDLRGYGRTALPPGPFRHVDDLTAVIAATGGGPVDLVGASLGGRVALDLALEEPDLVRSLVLLGTVVAGFEPDVDPPPLGCASPFWSSSASSTGRTSTWPPTCSRARWLMRAASSSGCRAPAGAGAPRGGRRHRR